MSADLRDFGLTPRLSALVQDVLRPGEQLSWVGKPRLHQRIDWRNYIGLWLFCCPFGCGGGLFLYLALTDKCVASGFGFFFAIVMSFIFLLFFVLTLVSPFYRLWKLRNTVYVITNLRTFVVGFDADSWPLKRGMVASNYQRRDAGGNRGVVVCQDEESWRFLEYGFMRIRDERKAEKNIGKNHNEPKENTKGALQTFGLTPQQELLVQVSLQAGEHVLWAGLPVRRSVVTRAGFLQVVVSLPAFAALFYFTDVASLSVCVAGLAVALLLAVLLMLLISRLFSEKRVYVISNRRAFICGGEDKSWPLVTDMVVSNRSAADGCGNLVFSLRPNPYRDVEDQREWIEEGFLDIRDVRLVEEILEKAIAERMSV